jgi:NAD-dependent oxidoreductase involved in siderophore biosynthesis
MAKRYRATLTAEERDELRRMIARGEADARKLAHAW